MNPIDLTRFALAQQRDFNLALSEIKKGKKISHWMWYIFPIFSGIGHSAMCKMYEITSKEEAAAYLKNVYLAINLITITEEVINAVSNKGLTTLDIFGDIDNRKLHACWTLFLNAATDDEQKKLFSKAIKLCFAGIQDGATLKYMNRER